MYEAPELLTVGEVRHIVLGEKAVDPVDNIDSLPQLSILDVD
jgi:hypothetical protein